MSQPKRNWDSRLWWLTILSGAAATILAGLPTAGAPAWVSLIVGAIGSGCSAGILFLRNQDVVQARQRQTVGDIMRAKDKERQ